MSRKKIRWDEMHASALIAVIAEKKTL